MRASVRMRYTRVDRKLWRNLLGVNLFLYHPPRPTYTHTEGDTGNVLYTPANNVRGKRILKRQQQTMDVTFSIFIPNVLMQPNTNHASVVKTLQSTDAENALSSIRNSLLSRQQLEHTGSTQF